MDWLEMQTIRESKKQRNLRDAFNGSVAIAGVVVGVFFLWLTFAGTIAIDGSTEPLLAGFLRVLSFMFGTAVAVAAVTFAYLKK